MTVYTIDFYGETSCPWCYIGKRHLDSAVDTFKARHPDASFQVTWKPYYLVPYIKQSGTL